MSSTGIPDEALGSGQLWVSPPSADIPLSPFITSFIQETDEAQEATSQPILNLPEEDHTHPIADYFISTSHNTYLLHNQLYGVPSPLSYSHVLSRHARCVEIDAWDSSSEPRSVIVTHGHTLVKSIPFRSVVEAIGQAVDQDPDGWPVWVALENHTGHEGQAEIVRTVKEVWGDKLITQVLAGVTDVTPHDLRGKILMEVEWYPTVAAPSAVAASKYAVFTELDSEVKKVVREVDPTIIPKIIPELAALGCYANSVKPDEDFLSKIVSEPANYLLNISESGLAKLLPTSMTKLIANNGKHLMRVYPEGTRIDSGNFIPMEFWRAGAHMPAQNWQTFDKGMHVNEGFYSGTKGWILKPASLRTDWDGSSGQRGGEVSLTLDVIAGCNIPRPQHMSSGEEYRLEVHCELFHTSGDKIQHTSSSEQVVSDHDSAGENPVWKETLNWKYEDEDLVFIRLKVVHKKWDGEVPVGIFCGRVDSLQQGWRLVRILDMKSRPTDGLLLLRFTITR